MVRKFAPIVNYTFSYITIFKGLMRLANLGGKSGHPQIHEVRLEVSVTKFKWIQLKLMEERKVLYRVIGVEERKIYSTK